MSQRIVFKAQLFTIDDKNMLQSRGYSTVELLVDLKLVRVFPDPKMYHSLTTSFDRRIVQEKEFVLLVHGSAEDLILRFDTLEEATSLGTLINKYKDIIDITQSDADIVYEKLTVPAANAQSLSHTTDLPPSTESPVCNPPVKTCSSQCTQTQEVSRKRTRSKVMDQEVSQKRTRSKPTMLISSLTSNRWFPIKKSRGSHTDLWIFADDNEGKGHNYKYWWTDNTGYKRYYCTSCSETSGKLHKKIGAKIKVNGTKKEVFVYPHEPECLPVFYEDVISKKCRQSCQPL